MTTESLPEHIRRPHLRTFQPLPVARDGQQMVALRDPAMLSQQTIVLPAQAVGVLQFFRGDRTIEEIAAQVQGEVKQFVDLAKALDQVGLLWGPTFERLESQVRQRLTEHGAFPVTASGSMGKDPEACRKAMAGYFAQTEDPELDSTPIGIIAPHLDYERGWPNYAAAYYPMQNTAAPDRVVVLGTNHFGIGDGVVLSELGFESPLGRCPADAAVVASLIAKLGPDVSIDQLDHLPEHSIQLHLPWIQHCFGSVPVVAALIPDPLTPMIEDDGKRASREQFTDALRQSLDEVGGRTFFIASSDLSHVGPQFGEPRAVDEQRRFDVERHDREMMAKYLTGDPKEFLDAMRWNKNPTRWCSIGSMTALLELTQPQSVELIDYRQAYDERGMVMVSSAALAIL